MGGLGPAVNPGPRAGRDGLSWQRRAGRPRPGAVPAHHQPAQEPLGQRSHAEREHHRSHAHGTAEQHAHRQRAQFDQGAHAAQRPAATPGQSGHQPVPRPRPQLRADIQRGGEGTGDHAGEHEQRARPQSVRRRQPRQVDVGEGAQQQRVGHRAQARHLPQRKPGQEHRDRGDHHHRAERQRHAAGHAQVEHVPRRGTQPALDHQRGGQPIDPQAGQQAHDPLGQAAGAQLRQRPQVE